MTAPDANKMCSRVIRFLVPGPARLTPGATGKGVLLEAGERGTISTERKLLARLVRDGLILLHDDRAALSADGHEFARRKSVGSTGFHGQHRDLGAARMEMEAGAETVIVNWAESPLGQLMRRKGKDGAAFLSAAEYQAGERLRSDYTRGQIMPRMSANWVATVASGRRDGGIADLTDAALAARQRVERAIVAVGPELSGILVDVCCFLKGMETVEMERGWPVRSAKIVLKTALGVLSRHYNPTPKGSAQSSRQTLHWGTEDYRPSIS